MKHYSCRCGAKRSFSSTSIATCDSCSICNTVPGIVPYYSTPTSHSFSFDSEMSEGVCIYCGRSATEIFKEEESARIVNKDW